MAKKPKPSPPPRGRPLFKLAAVLVVVASVGYGIATLGERAAHQLRNRERYLVPLDTIELDPPPNTTREIFLIEVRYVADLPTHLAALDPTACEQFHAAIAKHPWVERVAAMPNLGPGQYRLQITYRQPVLQVAVSDSMPRMRLVDKSGVLLPYREVRGDLPQLLGEYTIGRTMAGMTWDDKTIQRAVELVQLYSAKTIEPTAKGWRITETSGRVLVVP
jgi:hypothetical protein